MQAKTFKQLQKISQPRHFSKDEYICYEGELGNEMYIILRGEVGVYITNAMGTLTEVSTLKDGGFFGEMAIFDRLPRSASCIALEDTICVSISKENLVDFICECPDMAEKILENMSMRIRKLNNDLYKSVRENTKKKPEKFEIPSQYSFSHVVKEPYQDPRYFAQSAQVCPICEGTINVVNMKRNLMEVRNIDMDGRVNYMMCDPLWHEILSCPHCYYSNYRINFFNLNPTEKKEIKMLLKDEHAPVVEFKAEERTPFDNLVLKYLQAIHINETIQGGEHAFIGTLWLYLYWLGKDSGDEKFTDFCANKAIEKFQIAVAEYKTNDFNNKHSIALTLGNLFSYKHMEKQALEYGEMALESMNDMIRTCAEELVEKIRKK